MADEKVKQIRLSNIVIDAGIQPRAGGLDEGHVADLVAAIEAGDEIPPLVLYQNAATSLLLSEGFHRAEAYKRAGVKQVPCVVRKGERGDALANACGSNRAHGLKRTNADKRRAVQLLLEAFPQWSDRKIGDAAAVGNKFVGDIRRQVCPEHTSTREGKDGKQYPAAPNQAPTVDASTGEKRQGADGKDRSPPRQPQHSNNNQPATVAGCESGNAEENADSLDGEPSPRQTTSVGSTPPTIVEPDGTDYRQLIAEQARNEYGATPQQAAEMAEAMVELRLAVEGAAAQVVPVEPADEGGEFVAAVESLCRDMDQIAGRTKALKASRYSHSIHVDSAVAQVEAARKTLWQGRPAHVCPYCKGDDPACKPCRGTGRVKKATFDSGTKAVGEAA